MGLSFSCPFTTDPSDDENGIESVVVKSISFGDDDDKTPFRSVSFNSRNSEPMVMKSLDSGTMKIEGSISFERRELETVLSFKAPLEQEISMKNKQISNESPRSQRFSILDPSSPKHEAALKLQKVYKSFRTRRKLADCAVLVEQSWWKLLDFAELKRSSISFFDIEKHETAISRWSRARTRAAKVGKGLSKNDKAQKLALQHWLEAIDPRHRYGHNLHFYYVNWLHCQSREPFFYWLDIGEGREVNLIEKCPRLKLQQQCIKYLGPMERKVYEVVIEDGKFLYKQTGEFLHTTGEFKDAKSIFVLSTSKTLYVGRKKKGTFQHSSFLAGGATTAAGRLVVDNGILKAVWPHSGHYRPTEENFKDFVSFLKENNVDLTDVKMSPVEEEDAISEQRNSIHLRNNSSEEDLIQQLDASETEEAINAEDSTQEQQVHSKPTHVKSFSMKLTNLEIPTRGELFEPQSPTIAPIGGNTSAEEEAPTSELEETVPKESILQRINSHKGMKSYQLGKQLSCKWTTGAGPRIGCVRDYPAELQFRALEQVCLSPRSAIMSRSSPKVSETSATIMRSSSVPEKAMVMAQRSIHHSISWKQSSSPLCREEPEDCSITNITRIDPSISI